MLGLIHKQEAGLSQAEGVLQCKTECGFIGPVSLGIRAITEFLPYYSINGVPNPDAALMWILW